MVKKEKKLPTQLHFQPLGLALFNRKQVSVPQVLYPHRATGPLCAEREYLKVACRVQSTRRVGRGGGSGGHLQLVMIPGQFGGGGDRLIQPCMNQRWGLLMSSTVFHVRTKKHLNQELFWSGIRAVMGLILHTSTSSNRSFQFGSFQFGR